MFFIGTGAWIIVTGAIFAGTGRPFLGFILALVGIYIVTRGTRGVRSLSRPSRRR